MSIHQYERLFKAVAVQVAPASGLHRAAFCCEMGRVKTRRIQHPDLIANWRNERQRGDCNQEASQARHYGYCTSIECQFCRKRTRDAQEPTFRLTALETDEWICYDGRRYGNPSWRNLSMPGIRVLHRFSPFLEIYNR